MANSHPQKNKKLSLSNWSAAGFAIGFASGYVSLGGWVPGIILGIGLSIAMGLAGTSYTKKGK